MSGGQVPYDVNWGQVEEDHLQFVRLTTSGGELSEEQKTKLRSFFDLMKATWAQESVLPANPKEKTTKGEEPVAAPTPTLGTLQNPGELKYDNPLFANAKEAVTENARNFSSANTLRRYLVANQWDLTKAYHALLNTCAYRNREIPSCPGPDDEDLNTCLNTRYAEFDGHDRNGRPTMVIRSNLADLSISRAKRVWYMFITLEKGIAYMKRENLSSQEESYGWEPEDQSKLSEENKAARDRGVEQWNLIVDETDKKSEHVDSKFMQMVSPVLFSHYVERMNKCYIINPGILTAMVLKIIRIFLDDHTNSKIIAIDTKKEKIPVTPSSPRPGSFIVSPGSPSQSIGDVEEAEEATSPKSSKKSSSKTETYTIHRCTQLVAELGEENVPEVYGGTRKWPHIDQYKKWFHSIDPYGSGWREKTEKEVAPSKSK